MLDLHSDYEDLVFRSPEIEIGRFDVQPNDELFRDAGPIVTGQVVVFPKVPVFIQPEATKRFVADPNTTVFHDLGRPYQRFRLSSAGDQCNWFSFAPSLAREVVANIEPKAAEQEPLFKFTHGSTDTACYVVQQNLVRYLGDSLSVDSLMAQEIALRILEKALRKQLQCGVGDKRRMGSLPRTGRELTEEAKLVLANTFRDSLPLPDIATALAVSIFHLCRVFRKGTGLSLHGYRQQLRLRASLDEIGIPGTDLTELALDLGFSSHSHFTATFRRAFGFPPSYFRGKMNSRLVRELEGRLLA